MGYDANFIFNFASIITTLLFFSTAVITIFRRLRLRWAVRVNCWFCNNYTKVYRSELNWWQCSSCEQYNGFTKDGDYAYEIPEQSMQTPKSFAKKFTEYKKTDNYSKNYLCGRCNKNEELKMSKLRSFEPKGFFNSGYKAFKEQLETEYPLCNSCKVLVQKVLKKQSHWLTRYKMSFYKQKSVNAIINNAQRMDNVIRLFLTFLTSVVMCYPNYQPLPVLGAFLQTGTFLVNQARKCSDAVLTLLWICICLVGPLNRINLFELYERNEWPSLEHLTEHHFVTILTLTIGLMNATSKYQTSRNFNASFKKLESPNSKNSSSIPIETPDFQSNEEKNEPDTYSKYTESKRKQSVVTEKLASPTRKCDEEVIWPHSGSSEVSRDQIENKPRHLKFDGSSEHYTLNESLKTFKTLNLGESRSGGKSNAPNIFRTRVYGSTSPDLFHRTNKSKKFVLAPPKLKSFAQRSWVAGGYWQVGVDTPSLSRSSSQSSGFGSAGSNFGPSREPSVSKEIDKCSIVSDTFCYPSRPNSPNSINSCCQYFPQYARYENYNHPLKIIPNSLFLQNSHFSPVHPEPSVCCSSLQSSLNCTPIQANTQTSNNSTLFNNNLWLTILLGGSLFFNIAVFCIIVLR